MLRTDIVHTVELRFRSNRILICELLIHLDASAVYIAVEYDQMKIVRNSKVDSLLLTGKRSCGIRK